MYTYARKHKPRKTIDMNKTNVLYIGGDGRAHAIVWKLLQSPQAGNIYASPGNPGIALSGGQNIPFPSMSKKPYEALAELAVELDVGLVVIGSEDHLSAGAADVFSNRGLKTFGPKGGAWVVESSKAYAKLLMEEAEIPTAPFGITSSPGIAGELSRARGGKAVIKADGLAQGKGVFVCRNMDEAETAIKILMIDKKFGEAGSKVIVEDLLDGNEFSLQILTDGFNYRMLPAVKDYKRRDNNDEGLMTGGMGAIGPIAVDPILMKQIEETIIVPFLKTMESRNMPFSGCLYVGLMITKDGPKVLEFNARFGDPEAQVLMTLLHDRVDLIEVFLSCLNGRLGNIDLIWKDLYCSCITLAAQGYPETPRLGDKIHIISDESRDHIRLFHAGTIWKDGNLVTNGGRVLSLTTLFKDSDDRSIPYYEISYGQVRFNDMQYREDIGV